MSRGPLARENLGKMSMREAEEAREGDGTGDDLARPSPVTTLNLLEIRASSRGSQHPSNAP